MLTATPASRYPAPLDALDAPEMDLLDSLVTTVRYAAGAMLFREGSDGDSCYFIDEGEVRLEVDVPEVDTEGVLQVMGPGEILGELALLDQRPRSASAIADTAVVARRLPSRAIEHLETQNPRLAVKLIRALGRGAATKLRETNSRLADHLFAGAADPEVDSMVAVAHAAQQRIADWPEARIDQLITSVAEAIYANAELLAIEAVAETGYGNVADKTTKNKGGSRGVLRSLLGKSSHGVVGSDPARGLTDLAHPVGVVFGLVPVTNPISTAVFKTLIALKARNALILSFHRGAQKVGNHTCELMQDAILKAGAPPDLLGWVRRRSSRRKTAAFMAHPNVGLVLATGGSAMVHAAYSSGTPAIGVGPGNAPCLVCEDADLDAAAAHLVASKGFDHGVICASENHLVVMASVRDAFLDALESHGAAVLTPDEAARFRADAFDPTTHKLLPKAVGKSPSVLLGAIGATRERPVRLIVVPTQEPLIGNPFAKETLAPITTVFTVETRDQGVDLCRRLLEHEGIGHTCAIHTSDDAFIERFAAAMPASRIIANTGASQGILGIGCGLPPSLTLGCGTFGSNSTTDSVTFTHLLNRKHLARALETEAL